MKKLVYVFSVLLIVATMLTSCREKKTAGEKIQDGVEEVGDGIGDAVKAIETPVVEVHISNTFDREEFRHKSFVSPNAKGVILGFGLQSYELAIQSFL